MGGRDIQPLVMCGRCKFEGQMEKVGRWVGNLSWSPNLWVDCVLVRPVSKPCPVLPCCHRVMPGHSGEGTLELPLLSQPPQPPQNPLSVQRLAGRNQTFTTRAPPALVLLPQLINNRRTIVERTGADRVENCQEFTKSGDLVISSKEL